MPSNSAETDVLDRASSALNDQIFKLQDNTKLALVRYLGARLQSMSQNALHQIITLLSREEIGWQELSEIKNNHPVMRY